MTGPDPEDARRRGSTWAGQPVPYFGELADEAVDWAGWASLPELRAYAMAIFRALPPAEQAAALAAFRRIAQ